MENKYIAKKTRHKYIEAYNLTFENGLKAQVEKVTDGKWRNIISIGKTSHMFVDKDFDTLDDVAAYALQKAIDAKEWAKNNVIVI
tara:strand:- start:437 stop:691 length:255 start_codon:yes stop_codon:yes gene_type:complete